MDFTFQDFIISGYALNQVDGTRPHTLTILPGVYLPAPFRVAVSTVLDIYRWLEAPYRS
jgi:hypothetical protein